MRKLEMKSLLAVLLAAFCSVSFASSWPQTGNTRRPDTLTICTNYKSPRLLADTIRALGKQPFILFPAAETGDQRVFFMPAKATPCELRPEEVKDFIKYLNPKRIVVLGNETIVPAKFTRDLYRSTPIFRVDCSDWLKVAEQLEFMLNISGLGGQFRRLYEEFYSDNYRQTSLPAAPQAQEAPQQAEPQAEPIPAAEEAAK